MAYLLHGWRSRQWLGAALAFGALVLLTTLQFFPNEVAGHDSLACTLTVLAMNADQRGMGTVVPPITQATNGDWPAFRHYGAPAGTWWRQPGVVAGLTWALTCVLISGISGMFRGAPGSLLSGPVTAGACAFAGWLAGLARRLFVLAAPDPAPWRLRRHHRRAVGRGLRQAVDRNRRACRLPTCSASSWSCSWSTSTVPDRGTSS